MSNNDDLIKNADIQAIAEKGTKIYEGIKGKFDPAHKGEFLAIEISSAKTYLGKTSAEALEAARIAYPNTIFYVVKIGYDVAETMAQSFINAR